MKTDPQLIELDRQLRSDDPEVVEAALLEIAELLNLWSSSLRTGSPAVLANEEARAFVRTSLLEFIDCDPTRPVAATGIFVLGKLYDSSLESYLARLATIFLHDDDRLDHLWQVMIALDNIEAIPAFQLTSPHQYDPAVMRNVVTEYLEKRASSSE